MCEENNALQIDPLKAMKFVNKFVEITTERGTIIGKVYTIDPVSGSYILINKNSESNISMDVIPAHAVNDIKLIQKPDDGLDLDKLFSNKYKFSKKELLHRKESLKSWFTTNMVTVTEEDEVLKLYDCLDIHPPYQKENCLCLNSIILSRVQELMDKMENV